jgi:hypothetical protein
MDHTKILDAGDTNASKPEVADQIPEHVTKFLSLMRAQESATAEVERLESSGDEVGAREAQRRLESIEAEMSMLFMVATADQQSDIEVALVRLSGGRVVTAMRSDIRDNINVAMKSGEQWMKTVEHAGKFLWSTVETAAKLLVVEPIVRTISIGREARRRIGEVLATS